MKKLISFILILVVALTACHKPYQKKVTYITTGAISAYNLQYLDDQNELVNTEVIPQSEQDIWKYEYMSDQGEIVYINGNYKDINSALKIQLLIDGKVYKQAETTGDTIKVLVVSGVVPYE